MPAQQYRQGGRPISKERHGSIIKINKPIVGLIVRGRETVDGKRITSHIAMLKSQSEDDWKLAEKYKADFEATGARPRARTFRKPGERHAYCYARNEPRTIDGVRQRVPCWTARGSDDHCEHIHIGIFFGENAEHRAREAARIWKETGSVPPELGAARRISNSLAAPYVEKRTGRQYWKAKIAKDGHWFQWGHFYSEQEAKQAAEHFKATGERQRLQPGAFNTGTKWMMVTRPDGSREVSFDPKDHEAEKARRATPKPRHHGPRKPTQPADVPRAKPAPKPTGGIKKLTAVQIEELRERFLTLMRRSQSRTTDFNFIRSHESELVTAWLESQEIKTVEVATNGNFIYLQKT